MFLRSYSASTRTDEENPYWISFSDIMSGLLVIFILAALALILELTQTRVKIDEAVQELAKAEQVRKELLEEIRESLAEKNIFVIVSEDSSVIHINDEILAFDTDSAEIPDDLAVRERLLAIGAAMQQALTRDNRQDYLDTVFVEGHTDHRPSSRYSNLGGNWTLSTLRAISVWRFWEQGLDAALKLSPLLNYQSEPLFSVSGYAATRPSEKNGSASALLSDEQLRANRRIDLRFTLKQVSSGEFETVRAIAE